MASFAAPRQRPCGRRIGVHNRADGDPAQGHRRHRLAMRWHGHVTEVLEANGGIATRQELLAHVPATVLDGYVGRRALTRLFPHVYCSSGRHVDDHLLLRAALRHAGPGAAVSHTSALAVWGLVDLRRPVHLTVDQSVRRAGSLDLLVHRRLRFRPEPP
jgi:phage tail protein X